MYEKFDPFTINFNNHYNVSIFIRIFITLSISFLLSLNRFYNENKHLAFPVFYSFRY